MGTIPGGRAVGDNERGVFLSSLPGIALAWDEGTLLPDEPVAAIGAGLYGVPSSRRGTGAFGGPNSISIRGIAGCGGLIEREPRLECEDKLGEIDRRLMEECQDAGELCGEWESEGEYECVNELNEMRRSRSG